MKDKYYSNIKLQNIKRKCNESGLEESKKTFDKHNKAGTIVKQRKVVKT